MISIYTDGASGGRGGLPGGWGYVIVFDGAVLCMDYGGDASTTNNTMEVRAMVEGLRALETMWGRGLHVGAPCELVSDSRVALGLATGEYQASAKHIQGLVRSLRGLMVLLGEPRCRWVKGHAGQTFNEMADRLARRGKGETVADRVQRSTGG